MSESELDLDLEELSSAEDFLDYFGVAYAPAVVQVNRLHILQRFHDYLGDMEGMRVSEAERRVLYRDLLTAAYRDFVVSDALTEKVFKVFRTHGPQQAFVSLSSIGLEGPRAAEL